MLFGTLHTLNVSDCSGDESEWAGGDGYEDSDRPKRKGAGGKAGGKGGKKGGGGSPKGKSKGRANGGNYWRGS